MKVQRKSPLLLAAVGLAAVLTLSACTGGAQPSDNGGKNADTSALVAEAKSNVKALLPSTSTLPPSDAGSFDGDVNAWIVSCGEVDIGCSPLTAGASEAAKKLGWHVTVCDGNLGVGDGYNVCVRRAVAAQATVILTMFECDAAIGGLREAKAAGIPTIGLLFDCNAEFASGGDSLYTSVMGYTDKYPDSAAFYRAIGSAAADWIIAKTNGKAKVIDLTIEGVLAYAPITEAFQKRIGECSTCTLIPLKLGLGDFASGAAKTTVSTTIIANPDANAFFSPGDGLFADLEILQSLKASNRLDSMAILGAQGTRLDLITENRGEDAVIGWDPVWQGWGMVDTARQVLAGDTVAYNPTGLGIGLVDAKHNLPTSGTLFIDPIKYKAAFLKRWGL